MTRVIGSRGGKAGFTLVEIMTSVAVIAVIIAVALPMFSRIKVNANDTSIQKTMADFQNAVLNFQLNSGNWVMPQTLADLGPYLDSIGDGATHGYNITAAFNADGTWSAVAEPIQLGVTGSQTYAASSGSSGAVVSLTTATVEDLTTGRFSQYGPIINGGAGINLEDNFSPDGVATSQSYKYDAARGGWDTTWSFTNTLDKSVKVFAALSEWMNMGGVGAIGMNMVTDGSINATGTSTTETDYIDLGEIAAGQQFQMTYDWNDVWNTKLTPYVYEGVDAAAIA